MKFSWFYLPSFFPAIHKSEAQFYQHMLEETDRAETLGFHGVWCAEHHFYDYGGHIPSVAVGAPFTYFKDKEDILFHIVSKEQDLAGEQLVTTLSRQIAEATRTAADAEEVFKNVFATFLHSVDAMRRFILLAYQETKSLNAETRRTLMARERRLQALISEAIRYGAEQGQFTAEHVEFKAHNIMVMAHAWAIRHWVLAGEMESIEEYIEFLQPLVLAMLETKSGSGTSNKKRPQPATVGRRVTDGQSEVVSK